MSAEAAHLPLQTTHTASRCRGEAGGGAGCHSASQGKPVRVSKPSTSQSKGGRGKDCGGESASIQNRSALVRDEQGHRNTHSKQEDTHSRQMLEVSVDGSKGVSWYTSSTAKTAKTKIRNTNTHNHRASTQGRETSTGGDVVS